MRGHTRARTHTHTHTGVGVVVFRLLEICLSLNYVAVSDATELKLISKAWIREATPPLFQEKLFQMWK